MPFVYVLQNRRRAHYVGITALHPQKRLLRHNRGDVYSTKNGMPWDLLIIEEYPTMREARDREKQIKSWKGGNAFKKFLVSAAGSSNGRTAPFGGVYPGSNPGPAALTGKLGYPPIGLIFYAIK